MNTYTQPATAGKGSYTITQIYELPDTQNMSESTPTSTAKEAYYFSHDNNARQDRKIKAMCSKYKSIGYGCYWLVIEMLHREGGKLPLDILTAISLAEDAYIADNEAMNFIQDCINVFQLFESDGGSFWSPSLLRRMEKREEIRKVRAAAGRVGGRSKAEKRQVEANDKQNVAIAKQNVTKERKGKERERKEEEEGERAHEDSLPPTVHVQPSREDVLRYAEVQNIPEVSAETFYDHYAPNGWAIIKYDSAGVVTSRIPIHDWAAKLRNWHRDNSNRTSGSGALKQRDNRLDKNGVPRWP